MKKLLKIILIILFLPISLPILIIKSKMPKALKIILIILHIAFWAWLIFSPSKYTAEELAATKTARVALTPTKTDTPEPTATEPPTETPIPTDTPVPTDTPEPSPTPFTVSIKAGSPNEYSEQITIGAGSEFEQTYFGYFLPAGDYMAQNMDTKHFSQISVMSRETHITEEGWEEAADGNAYSFKEGETKRITIPDGGYYIKVVEPASFTLIEADPE